MVRILRGFGIQILRFGDRSDEHDIELAEVKDFGVRAGDGSSIDMVAILLVDVDLLGRPVQVLHVVEVNDISVVSQILQNIHWVVLGLGGVGGGQSHVGLVGVAELSVVHI